LSHGRIRGSSQFSYTFFPFCFAPVSCSPPPRLPLATPPPLPHRPAVAFFLSPSTCSRTFLVSDLKCRFAPPKASSKEDLTAKVEEKVGGARTAIGRGGGEWGWGRVRGWEVERARYLSSRKSSFGISPHEMRVSCKLSHASALGSSCAPPPPALPSHVPCTQLSEIRGSLGAYGSRYRRIDATSVSTPSLGRKKKTFAVSPDCRSGRGRCNCNYKVGDFSVGRPITDCAADYRRTVIPRITSFLVILGLFDSLIPFPRAAPCSSTIPVNKWSHRVLLLDTCFSCGDNCAPWDRCSWRL
jgi:hypothetical protein